MEAQSTPFQHKSETVDSCVLDIYYLRNIFANDRVVFVFARVPRDEGMEDGYGNGLGMVACGFL